jgi:hypothetical protein
VQAARQRRQTVRQRVTDLCGSGLRGTWKVAPISSRLSVANRTSSVSDHSHCMLPKVAPINRSRPAGSA